MVSVEILPVGDQIQPSASLQLFAFPHAGGHAKSFATWDQLLAQVGVGVDMYCASLPSRTGGIGDEKVKISFQEVVYFAGVAFTSRLPCFGKQLVSECAGWVAMRFSM